MATFILASILIVLATLAALVWPLLFTRNTFSYARHAQNIHYAKERLAELEEQLKNASISATDYEALKLEIETTLAQDIDLANQDKSDSTPLPRRPNKMAISILCLFVPLGAAAFYTYVGTPEALDQRALSASNNSEQTGTPTAEEVRKMITDLEQRLVDNPNDLQGWSVLSRTYLALGQYPKAANALKRVLDLGGESDQTYASLADASALAKNGDMTGAPTTYADKALVLNPGNRQALWLRGLAATQVGDKVTARRHWTLLLEILANEPEQQAQLRQIMRDAMGPDADIDLTSRKPAEQTDIIADDNPNKDAISPSIRVTVSLAAEVADKVNKQDYVFVFASAIDGPPAPLAVKRLTVADLPTTVSLSDQDAMMPQLKMSLFKEVNVMARVSKSGQPIAQAGDWESDRVKSTTSEPAPVTVTISRLLSDNQ